jgi:RNA polymerase sigma-70 factor, ECF subfamily
VSATVETPWEDLSARLRGFIARRVGDETEAEDILQEVLLRIHRHGDTLQRATHVHAWVYQIARNAIADSYRARGAHAALVTALTEHAPLAQSAPASADLRAELAACLAPMIDRLPDAYRQAITLTEVEGLTQEGAATRLGLSVPGMKARVQRARRRLKAMLLDCCQIELDRRGGIAAYETRDASCRGCCAEDVPSV